MCLSLSFSPLFSFFFSPTPFVLSSRCTWASSSGKVQSDKLHRCPVARVSRVRPRHFVRPGGLFSTVQAASLSECVRPFRTTSAHVKATTIPFDKQQTRTNVRPPRFRPPSRAPLVFINLKVLSAKRLRRSRVLSLAIVRRWAK